MTSDFQQTVNLKDKMQSGRKPEKEPEKIEKKPAPIKPKSQAEEIDRVYKSNFNNVNQEPDLKKINRPLSKNTKNTLLFQIIAVLTLVVIVLSGYIFISNKNKKVEPANVEKPAVWYAVKLINGEEYYGQIEDTKADPVIIKNVYYNYDQIKPEGEKKAEGTNLRLVKRGNEAHGPSGTMDIVRAQVAYMEPLKEDSKVLKAILDYEKK
jgi:hypothetical protein